MPPRPPLLLVDNLLDTVQLYPNAALTASSERTGHEAFRVADYRRERTSWQTATTAANHYLQVDLGAGMTRSADFLFLDRGHNLWGKTLQIRYGAAGVTLFKSLTVPALGTLGGDPTVGMSVTEEGACYALFDAPAAAQQVWRVVVVESVAPTVTGLLLGARAQLLRFSTTFDEDARERTQASSTSPAGYRATDTTYSWRTCEIGLSLIGAENYDGQVRALSTLLFDRNQPCVIAMDHGTRPERAWMFQLDATTWKMPKTRVYRSGRMLFREIGPSIG